jgi:hypothetical protein
MNEKQRNKFLKLVEKVSEPPHGCLATKMSDRFQDQPWCVKLWRYRWYFRVPYDTLRIYFNSKMANKELGLAYSIALGEAHYRMNWLYSMEEAMRVLENKRKK